MPRALKSDKFFLYSPTKSGFRKQGVLVGVNHNFEGGSENVKLHDLIEFLKKNNIDPADVPMGTFTVLIPVKGKS